MSFIKESLSKLEKEGQKVNFCFYGVSVIIRYEDDQYVIYEGSKEPLHFDYLSDIVFLVSEIKTSLEENYLKDFLSDNYKVHSHDVFNWCKNWINIENFDESFFLETVTIVRTIKDLEKFRDSFVWENLHAISNNYYIYDSTN